MEEKTIEKEDFEIWKENPLITVVWFVIRLEVSLAVVDFVGIMRDFLNQKKAAKSIVQSKFFKRSKLGF